MLSVAGDLQALFERSPRTISVICRSTVHFYNRKQGTEDKDSFYSSWVKHVQFNLHQFQLFECLYKSYKSMDKIINGKSLHISLLHHTLQKLLNDNSFILARCSFAFVWIAWLNPSRTPTPSHTTRATLHKTKQIYKRPLIRIKTV